MEVVQQNLKKAVPPSVKENVKDFRESASDFWAEGVANAVENLGFGANTAHVEKVVRRITRIPNFEMIQKQLVGALRWRMVVLPVLPLKRATQDQTRLWRTPSRT